jgi:hypothetical protein
MRILKEWRVTWTFFYAYIEGKESYLDILLYENVQVTLLYFKIRIGEYASNTPFLQNMYRRMSR